MPKEPTPSRKNHAKTGKTHNPAPKVQVRSAPAKGATFDSRGRRNKTITKLAADEAKLLPFILADMPINQAAVKAGLTIWRAYHITSRSVTFREKLAEARTKLIEEAPYTAAQVMLGLGHIAFADLRTLFDDNGALKPVCDWDDSIAQAVSKVEVDEIFEGFGAERVHIGYTKKVHLNPKAPAFDGIAKMLGAYKPQKVDLTGRIPGLAELLEKLDGADVGPGPSGD